MDIIDLSTPSPSPNDHSSLPLDLENPDHFAQYSSMRLRTALVALPPADNHPLRQKFLDGLDWELVSLAENLQY